MAKSGPSIREVLRHSGPGTARKSGEGTACRRPAPRHHARGLLRSHKALNHFH